MATVRSRAGATALALVCLIAGTLAPRPAAGAGDHEQVALYRLFVDGLDQGEALVTRRAGEVWLSLDALERAGLEDFGGRREMLDGAFSVSLSSLAPHLTFISDEARLELRLLRSPSDVAAPAGEVHDQVFVLSLDVDGQSRGAVLGTRRGVEIYLAAEALNGSGVPIRSAPQKTIDGVPQVALSSLPAPTWFELDERTSSLRIVTVPESLAAGHDGIAVLQVSLNGGPAGDAIVVEKRGELWVAVESLEAAGLSGFSGRRAPIDGAACVMLSSLAPGLTFRVDERSRTLDLTAAPELLPNALQVALLDLFVNEEAKGETRARLSGEQVSLPVSALEAAGLRGFGGARTNVDGEEYVALASLAPGIVYQVDEREFRLSMTASAEHFVGQRRMLADRRPADIVYRRDTSLFVNYALDARGQKSVEALSGAAEAGLSVRGSLLSSTFSRSSDGRVHRGFTQWSVDDRKRLVRWTAGDQFGSTGALGGGAVLGGLSVSRDFGLDPYLVTTPTKDLHGVATTPSIVDVYVNDKLVRSEALPPGKFELENVLLESGHGSTRLVIRDAFGREQQITSGYYQASNILAPGRQEYAYNLGLVRDPAQPAIVRERPDRGDAVFTPTPGPAPVWDGGTYGTPAFLGRHRVGVTNWLTASARLEGTTEIASGGATLVAGLPIGQLEVSGAASSSDTGERASGTAGEARLTFASRRFGGGAAIKAMSAQYATISLRPEQDRATTDVVVFAGIPVGSLGSVNVQEQFSESRSGQRTSRTSGAASFRILRRSTLSVTASHSRPEGKRAEMAVFAGISVSLGSRDIASAGHAFDPDGGGSSVVNAQRSLAQGSGYGYRVAARRDVSEPGRLTEPSRPGGTAIPDVGSGALQAQTGFGRYELGATGHREGSAQYSANVAGGIVAVGGGVYATRPVQQSFALVRVPGVQGVRVLASNQEVGRTNRNGNLLIPNLLPFYGNRLAIEDQDVPMDFEITETARTVAPPHRGAAVVTFPIRRIQAVIGSVKIRAGRALMVPAFGQLSVSTDAPAVSPVGKGGEFYFESLPAGRHSAELRFRGETCRFTLNVPSETGASIVDLGTLTCVSR